MNKMKLIFKAQLVNEAFARTSVIAFLMPLNPQMEEVMEIKTIIAEAVVNSMLHGYENDPCKEISIEVEYDEQRLVKIQVEDQGVGIVDIEQARLPLFTTKAELERSGMGMTIMETFSDQFEVTSIKNQGTKVNIQKQLKAHE